MLLWHWLQCCCESDWSIDVAARLTGIGGCDTQRLVGSLTLCQQFNQLRVVEIVVAHLVHCRCNTDGSTEGNQVCEIRGQTEQMSYDDNLVPLESPDPQSEEEETGSRVLVVLRRLRRCTLTLAVGV